MGATQFEGDGMTIDKAKLKALAEAALIGNWFEAGDIRYCDDKTGEIHGLHHDDSRLIAAASPQTILALLAEIDRLERKNNNQSETIKKYHDHFGGGDSILRIVAERDHLKAENEALRKDAERLSWLDESKEVDSVGPTLCCGKHRPTLREAIDIAMSLEQRLQH